MYFVLNDQQNKNSFKEIPERKIKENRTSKLVICQEIRKIYLNFLKEVKSSQWPIKLKLFENFYIRH